MAPAGAKVLDAAPVGAGEAADEGLEAALPAPPVAALVGDPAVELAADSTESVAVLTASVEAAGTVLRGHVMTGQPGDRCLRRRRCVETHGAPFSTVKKLAATRGPRPLSVT